MPVTRSSIQLGHAALPLGMQDLTVSLVGTSLGDYPVSVSSLTEQQLLTIITLLIKNDKF